MLLTERLAAPAPPAINGLPTPDRVVEAWFPDIDYKAATGAASPTQPAPLQMICIPYAGGTPSIFRGWAAELGTAAEVIPVLLPGRGLRGREQPYTTMQPLVEDLVTALIAHGLDQEYALFGHSMGALVAYEVACELRRRGHLEPAHLFVSGSKAPHLYGDRADHLLADSQLCQLVRDLGGLGPDEQTGEAYLQRRLPVLRADLTVCERYRWSPRPPLRCPMTAISGVGDPIATAAQVEAWRAHTTGSLLRRHVPGGHFYLLGPARSLLLTELHRELDALARARAGAFAELSGRNRS